MYVLFSVKEANKANRLSFTHHIVVIPTTRNCHTKDPQLELKKKTTTLITRVGHHVLYARYTNAYPFDMWKANCPHPYVRCKVEWSAQNKHFYKVVHWIRREVCGEDEAVGIKSKSCLYRLLDHSQLCDVRLAVKKCDSERHIRETEREREQVSIWLLYGKSISLLPFFLHFNVWIWTL